MKALISPIEPSAQGWRIVETAAQAFPVARPLFWVDVASDVSPATHIYLDGVGVQLAQAQEAVLQVPASVTMRQARLALLGAGLLDDVDAAIAAIPDATQRRAATIEWEYAQTVDRASPFAQQMAAGLGITQQQLDALFVQAATL